jgi:hypothetical protein
VGAADTEDFERWLIAWVWHNPKAKDQVWSVMEAAKSMGGKISEAEASAVTEEASITRKHLTADNLARFLGVTYAQRQALRLTTIGSVNVGKRARKEMRKRQDRLAKERKRRAAGMRPQSESLSATKPWTELGMSRAAWYRRNKARRKGETTLSVRTELSQQGCPSGSSTRSKRRKKEDFRLRRQRPRWLLIDMSQPIFAIPGTEVSSARPAVGRPSAKVITADDPRMVARMAAANGGDR